MNNQMFNQIFNMIDGKSTQERLEIANNIAKQKGIDDKKLKELAQQYGIKL